MINNRELEISNKSYTHKDFYQIYPEILEQAQKISSRWNPSTTNETDPGIVLLKLAAFVADKNNYNIDKNILEAFLLSATQDSSMRQLCDMLGYDMSYNKSAVVTLTITYKGSFSETQSSVTLPALTTVTTKEDENIARLTYFLLKSVTFTADKRTQTVDAMEGSLTDLSVGNSNLITLSSIDDNNRVYLSETQIAENGIFIINSDELVTNENDAWTSRNWTKVDNLNTQLPNSKVWKFGFDSSRQLPYIQFPDDVATLIGEGLNIKYVRTQGVNGNVSAYTLTKLELSEDADNYTVTNTSSTNNGVNAESIDEAYNGFKKTVGTFDTLVTCRDYANYIYSNIFESDGTTPLVSNVQVGDARTDILNRVSRVMSFDANGVNYKDIRSASSTGFDIYLYTLGTFKGAYNDKNYNKSFSFDSAHKGDISKQLDDIKTIAHNIADIGTDDAIVIKNKYALKAQIITTYKVNATQQYEILSKVYAALIRDYNAREVDFGYEIPYDSLQKTIQEADVRIKYVVLEEPVVTPYLLTGDNGEKLLNSDDANYIKFVAKNVLAGRLPLFKHPVVVKLPLGAKTIAAYSQINYDNITEIDTHLALTSTQVQGNVATYNFKPYNNEYIQFRTPSLNTSITYTFNVYYRFVSNNTVEADTDYTLQEGDTLYIRYTDSEGNVKDVSYLKDQIIRPNFKLSQDMSISGKTFASDDTVTATIAGWYALGSKEQIEIRNEVKLDLTQTYYCYWITATGKLPFTKIGQTSDYEYTLENGEYFFVTDEAKSELFRYGAGTRLVISNSDDTFVNKTFGVILDSLVSLDDIVDNGLKALDTYWQSITFGDENNKLTIQEMSIQTFDKSSTLESVTGLTAPISALDNTWKLCNSAVVTLADNTNKTINKVLNRLEVRTRYDLDIGPNTSQVLQAHESATSSITLKFKQPEGAPAVPPVTISVLNGINPSILSNIVLQASGNTIIVNDETLTLSVYQQGEVTSGSTSAKTEKDGDYTSITFTGDNVTIPIIVPTNKQSTLFIYPSLSADLTITSDKSSIYNLNNGVETWPISSFKNSESVSANSPVCLLINESCTLTLSANGSGSIIVGSVRIIDGIDTDTLGILGKESALMKQIHILSDGIFAVTGTANPIEGKPDIFVYDLPLDDGFVIDGATMSDSSVWFSSNNICNRFVIPQLDTTSFKNITIHKSSRL